LNENIRECMRGAEDEITQAAEEMEEALADAVEPKDVIQEIFPEEGAAESPMVLKTAPDFVHLTDIDEDPVILRRHNIVALHVYAGGEDDDGRVYPSGTVVCVTSGDEFIIPKGVLELAAELGFMYE